MNRRSFLIALTASSLGGPATAQQQLPLLAILSPVSPRNAAALKQVHEPFKQALAKLGYEPGRNIEIVERFAEGDEARLPALAAELVALQPRVLFTNTANAATAAAHATRTIPIVVGPAGESTLLELAGGLARPTTNVTGFVLSLADIDIKCLALLMEVAPAARRIGVLINPRNPSEQEYPARLNAALSASGVTLIRLESVGLTDIDAALAKASAERIGALLVADDAHLAGEAGVRQHILKFTAVAGIAVASSNQNFARDGALLAMGPSVPVLAAAAAGYVDKILKGAKPADLPVQLPSVFTMIINMKTAIALGLIIPPTLLARADEVIE
jgi:ABC-type uncharacterized transport system substrate-binding protein